jgi:photosystem II stability/assembly factor-like uncharacterized protein
MSIKKLGTTNLSKETSQQMRKSIVLFLAYALFVTALALPSGAQKKQNNTPGKKTVAHNESDLAENGEEDDDPDLPQIARGRISRDEYLKAREEQISFLRGLNDAKLDSRVRAIYQMTRQEIQMNSRLSPSEIAALPSWRPIGPAPILVSGGNSGRVSAIAVHPTNPNIAYVGAAQGGLYRTLNGGATWTPLMDSALSLSIGAIAIAPSDPTIVFVGTGESAQSLDSFFGVGIYRITNADSANPVLAGPLNLNSTGGDVFTGRSISEILVHPTDANIIFASTTSGVGGISGSQPASAAARGVYRSTNALAASPIFARLNVPNSVADRSVTDMVMEPASQTEAANPNHIYIGALGATAGDGGVFETTNALDANPTFTQVQATTTTGSGSRVELAANKVGSTLTVIAATGDGNGTLYKFTTGGSWSLLANNSFCNPQCFYDIAVAMDHADANKVYLGGSPTLVFGRSTNGGASFTSSSSGLHVDTHAIAVAPSDPNTIYFGSDGGIWKSSNGGTSWINLNNSTFSATQFEGLSLHPLDRYYMIGGTQDNGTEYLRQDRVWIRSDGGDGGFSAIDQNAPNISNVTAYHTYFNRTNSQIGFARATTTDTTGDPNWTTFLGCGGTANGINCADAVLFYAPMVLGPGNPNTVYFGTDRLYRSDNQGTTMTLASQGPIVSGARVSAIGIAKQEDKVRIAGLTNGQVWATTTGSATLTNITGAISPLRYIGRAVIDPNNVNTAYVTLSGFGVPNGQHIWKTTNLDNATPTWTAAGSGIPDVPVSAFAVDPANSNILYAGTDIGVYRSMDGGASWQPFSIGLPRVAVFEMAIHPVHRFLRIATHGRGIWEINLRTRITPGDFDGDGKTDIAVWRPSNGVWYITNSSNNSFRFETFGLNGDRVSPGDFDGDGRTDLGIYRTDTWYLQRSEAGFLGVPFGLSGDRPVAGDFDGDGKSDIALWRPSTGFWYVLRSTDGSFFGGPFGVSSDLPTPGDFDGDGKTDLAVYRPSEGNWYVLRSSDSQVTVTGFGVNGDKPVVGDYDGDGKSDIAVYRPSGGLWFILRSTGGFDVYQFGVSTDIPTQGDYDGDGKADIGIFRPADGVWYALQSTAGLKVVQFGTAGDAPAPSGYNPQ